MPVNGMRARWMTTSVNAMARNAVAAEFALQIMLRDERVERDEYHHR